MPFCSYSQSLFNSNYTVVSNKFISEYMLDSPKNCLEAYLFGLYLCSHNDSSLNNVELFCKALHMTEDDVLDAFTYWEELGLVQVMQRSPLEIYYLPITDNTYLLKKLNPSKYKTFNREIESILCDRTLTPNEFNEYYLFLETTFFQPEALLRVARYCAETKGHDIGYKYILAVAHNLNNAGVKTLEAVDEKLSTHPLHNEQLQKLMTALGVRRQIDFSDRELYEKWTNVFGFRQEVLLQIVRSAKPKTMQRLDTLLGNYYRLGLLDQKEIENYEQNKTQLYEQAKQINKIIGVYYQSLDYIVEEYIAPWQQKGFSAEALQLIAKYCFRHSVRTLAGMNDTVEKFYKKGLVTVESIQQYLSESIATDRAIREVLDALSLSRNVTTQDRTNYRLWTQDWGFSQAMLLQVANVSSAAQNPMAYFNATLSQCKRDGIFTAERFAAQHGTKKPQKPDVVPESTNYTQEELDSLFDNLES